MWSCTRVYTDATLVTECHHTCADLESFPFKSVHLRIFRTASIKQSRCFGEIGLKRLWFWARRYAATRQIRPTFPCRRPGVLERLRSPFCSNSCSSRLTSSPPVFSPRCPVLCQPFDFLLSASEIEHFFTSTLLPDCLHSLNTPHIFRLTCIVYRPIFSSPVRTRLYLRPRQIIAPTP